MLTYSSVVARPPLRDSGIHGHVIFHVGRGDRVSLCNSSSSSNHGNSQH